MKIFLTLLILSLVSPAEMLASSIVSRASRELAQAALLYAEEHGERLPGSIEEIPNHETILQQYQIPLSSVSYVAPPNATLMYPSSTPLIMIRHPHELVTIVSISMGTEHYRWTPDLRNHQGLPPVLALACSDPFLTISLTINLLLGALLVYGRIRK